MPFVALADSSIAYLVKLEQPQLLLALFKPSQPHKHLQEIRLLLQTFLKETFLV
jgi:hypothetical protein